MSILIVDDSATQRKLLQQLLKKGGFTEVILAKSAKEAFECLGLNAPEQAAKIDLILMDILMPEINGLEACRQIKAAEHLRDIPIIMVTGMSDVENLETAFAAGAMDYIVKPAKELELFARVRSSLKLKEEIDKRKARERQLMREIDKRRQAEEKLLYSEKLQGVLEMAGAICHELNQPLQSISGYSELLLKNITEDDQHYGKIKVIKEQADRLKKITGKLAGITRYETKDYLQGIKIIDIDKAST